MALITAPSLKVVSSSFRMNFSVAESTNPFGLQTDTYDWGGSRWEGEVTLRPYTYDDTADIRAFLAKLRGKANTFLYGDPDYLIKGPRGSFAGTPLVAGASQTGNTLDVDGFTALQTNVARAGDYIQLGTGASSELYMVTDDADSDSSGAATLNLNRNLLNSPANNSAIVSTGAKGVFRLSENTIEWNSDQSSVTDITIAFMEVL